MGHQQLLFIFLGVILVGIALLTEYLSTNNVPNWAKVNQHSLGTINKSVVISGKNISEVAIYKKDNNTLTSIHVNNGSSRSDVSR